MRIESISLAWFRGVAHETTLAPKGKSVVVYGPNGAGKSTFPDALEYLLTSGKIGHLQHEYSGTKLERAVRNTHAPDKEPAQIELKLADGGSIVAKISPNGRCALAASKDEIASTLASVGLERLILRQDEVSRFVRATKGEKYSALLPLLGLASLERAAANLSALQKAVVKKGLIKEKRQRVTDLGAELEELGAPASEAEANETLGQLASDYLDEELAPGELSRELLAAIEKRAETLDQEHRRYNLLREIAESELDAALEELIHLEQELDAETDRLLSHQVGVLESTEQYLVEVGDANVDCPACGRAIEQETLAEQVSKVLGSLKSAQDARKKLKTARQTFMDKARDATRSGDDESLADVKSGQTEIAEALSVLRKLEIEPSWSVKELTAMQAPLEKGISAIQDALSIPPPTAADLMSQKRMVWAAASLLERNRIDDEVSRLERLESALDKCEKAVRERTKQRTREVVEALTVSIQRLWEKLHPGEKVEDIHLHLPNDADKAIDIALKFHGVEQPSPRLTLSEGHRNSLGLCIFFALALEGGDDTPVVLDDIVSSLDREHRGMLVNVFLEDFADRQVLLFTHDREWYSELRARLPEKQWKFQRLKPWANPTQGSRWSDSSGSFDDARALLKIKPEAAGNEVRKIMDVELAKIAERLHVELPFQRGDRNDHRTCFEFLEKIISIGKTKLTKKDGDNGWQPHEAPITVWEEARDLLVSLGNRASHGGSLTQSEADLLLSRSEEALAAFKCEDCNDWLWASDQASRGRLQCTCSAIRWKYG